jgi:hypothetical protein
MHKHLFRRDSCRLGTRGASRGHRVAVLEHRHDMTGGTTYERRHKTRQRQSRRGLARQACILISPAAGSALEPKGCEMDCRLRLRTDLPVQRPRLARRPSEWVRTMAMFAREMFRRPLLRTDLDYSQRLLKT